MYSQTWSIFFLLILPTLLSCAGPVPLTVRAFAESNGKRRPLTGGEILHSGDQFALFVQVDVPAYLYMVQFYPDRTSAQIFPPADFDVRLPAGKEQRIPKSGWFRLNQTAGAENIYILASRRPLREADSLIAGTLGRVRVSAPPFDEEIASLKETQPTISNADPQVAVDAGQPETIKPSVVNQPGPMDAPVQATKPPVVGSKLSSKAPVAPKPVAAVHSRAPAALRLDWRSRAVELVDADGSNILRPVTDLAKEKNSAVTIYWFHLRHNP